MRAGGPAGLGTTAASWTHGVPSSRSKVRKWKHSDSKWIGDQRNRVLEGLMDAASLAPGDRRAPKERSFVAYTPSPRAVVLPSISMKPVHIPHWVARVRSISCRLSENDV